MTEALKATFDDSPMFPEIDPPGRPSTSLGLSQRPLSFPPAPGTGITPNAYGPPVVYLASGSNFFITNVTVSDVRLSSPLIPGRCLKVLIFEWLM